MISYPFGSNKLKAQWLNNYPRNRTIATKFAKALFTVSLSICLLVVPILGAMSRAEVQGQSSSTSEDQSTVNPINRAKAPVPMMILYGTMENANTFVPPPPLQKLSQRRGDLSAAQSQFIVTYIGFTREAQVAFQYAVDIWDSLIRSPVPIRIEATFRDLGGDEDGSIILGGAQPAGRRESASLGVWVADALADNQVGRDLNVGEPDIITSFNSHAAVDWYFGTDGNTPSGKRDFVSVVLHEIGHGLGFFSSATLDVFEIEIISISVDRGKLRSGNPELPEIYDIFVENEAGKKIIAFDDPSNALLDAFTGNNLFWNGPNGKAANNGDRPKLYAPDPWERGSSYSHLDEYTFPAGDPNSLMTPRHAWAEASHHPGPITLGIFEDMGWTINKGPAFTDGSSTTRSVAENTGAGVNIDSPVAAMDANSADPNVNTRDSLTYTLSGIDAGSFAIEQTTGQLKTLAALDYETQSAYTVTVTVSDGRLIDEIAVTISVSDVVETPTNSPPAFTDGPSATRTVAENTGAGVNIGDPVAATDADSGETLTYTLGGADAVAFEIDSTSGQLRTKAALDYETKATHAVTVTVSDGSLTVSIAVTIDVSNVNDVAPVFIEGASTTRSVVENTASGVDIGRPVAATDADNESLTYTLSGADSASFEVDRTSGQLRTRAALDHETKPAYNTVTLTVSDGSHTVSITVTVEVTDVVETPTNRGPVFTEGASASRTVAENTGSGADIGGAVMATDADNDSLTYTLSGTDAAVFDIITTTGQLRTEAALDYETKNAYTVTVAVSDGSLTASITVTITVTDLLEVAPNTAPAFTEGSSTSRSVAENTEAGVNIGAPVVATDVDSGTTLIYSLGGSSASSFDIEPLSGQLRTKRALDYETRASYTVTVTVTDGSLTDSITVTINVTDVPESPTNRGPVFTAGSSTTRSIAENTRAGVNIGSPVSATDPDSGDTLTYTLGGSGASAFDIDRTSGQLRTRAALDYETRASYTVTVTVTDGILSDESTVTISVTDVSETPTNRGPVFTEGSSTTRSVAENTGAGVNIGPPVAATDADNDSLTYSLSGLDAASFEIDRTSGQLKTLAALDYETRTSYTVTVSVSDGSLTDTITVTIAVTDQDDLRSPTVTLASQPLTEATLNGSVVTLRLRERKYEEWLSDPVTASGIPGVTVRPSDIDRVSDTELQAELTFDGTDLDTNATLTFTVKAEAIANYNDSALTATAPVTAGTESVVASSATPLTEAILNGSVVTLTLSGGVYESRYTVGNNVTVSGIAGVTVNRFDVDRVSDTQVVVELIFDGTDFDTDAALTFTVEPDAVAGYNGAALIAQLPVIPVVEENPTVTASTPQPLTEATLNQSLVTLTLNSGVYVQSSADISRAVQVAGLGVTFSRFNVARISDTQVTVPLTFDGTDFDTDATLTFTIGADAIANYNGPALSTGIPVTAVVEERPTITVLTPQPFTEATLDGIILLTLNNGTYVRSPSDIKNAITVSGIVGITVGRYVRRESDTQIAVELEFNGNIDTDATLTFTVGAGAIAGYNGPALIVQVSVTGGQESVAASTAAPLTESTLHGSVVTLTLNGATYKRSTFDLRDAVELSGIAGVTYHWFDLDRISDTELTVELKFNGNIDTDATLTFTVGADAMAGYNGPALITTLPVTGGKESVVVSTEAPLTESTLDESVVTLTLSGGVYESEYTVGRNVTVSGIVGVTFLSYNVDRVSDTEITVELDFEGNFDTDVPLTLAVEAGALVGYNGPALIATLPITGGKESVVASTKAPLTEATLDESVVTLTLSGGVYESEYTVGRNVTVSGIVGVTVNRFDVDRVSDTEITVELKFNGNIDTDVPLTLAVEAGALVGYNGPALITTLPVTGGQESIVASTEAPLTESTLDESVVTLTLSGGVYESEYTVGRNVTVSGIVGVTFLSYNVDRVSDTEITVELDFEGNFDTDVPLTLAVEAGALVGYNGPALIATLPVTGGKESIVASTEAPLTEATLDESVVTLTLSGGVYESEYTVGRNVTVSGIVGVTVNRFDVDRVSDTEITVELKFNGNIDTDVPLTLAVEAGALVGYNGPALITTLPVTGGQESIVASTEAPLTEATLDESVVTLTLSGGVYESEYTVGRNVTVSGIVGVTFLSYNVDRVSDTEITVELDFEGNFDTDVPLTLAVEAGALVGYNGPALIATLPVTGGKESIVASTEAPLTEATLDESVVTLTLSGGVYESEYTVGRNVTVSGIVGVTVNRFDVDRVSDTEITVELDFEGNFDTDVTLTLAVEAGALVGYNGPALITQLPVTGGKESVVASTEVPLTEATLDESVVTLTLIGGVYESEYTVGRNVTVSGIAGVTFRSYNVDRISDTVITIELEFDGNLNADATLTFTVGADAIAGYNGPALIAQLLVTTGQTPAASLVASTRSPLTETTLDGSVVTLTLTGGTYERSLRDIRDAVTVSGISGVTVGTLGISRVSDMVVTVELRFNGNLHTDGTLIFTVGADAIANYNGPALTAILPVTAVVEAVVEENPTIAETSLMAIEGTIKTEDGIPAEAGLQVTVIIGSNTQTGVSEVGGVYTVTILNLQGDVVATSGDTVTVQVRNPDTGVSVERTVQLSSQQILAEQATIDLQFSPTPSTTDREYLLSVPAGISLIHVPLKVTAVDGVAQTLESVGDLYDALGGAATVSLLITYDPETGRWNSYLHDGYRGRPGDKTLTDDLGIIASMKVPKSALLSGDALGTNGRSSITLHPRINLVGVPLKDSRITRVSDLLKLNGIAGNVSVIIVSDNGFKVVAQAGDPGDIPVTGGQAFILTARNAATVEITGTKWSNPLGQTAAPSTALTGIQTDGVTPVLAVTGSISPVVGKSVRPFHVTVKNRSTGTVDTAMTDDDGVSYQFTFVDIETSRAAQVGDILEITAHCPDPFVGVQPLRHTVTDEDVKRNWISLGELVAYEIPAKTELLSNYPNPFNPETWIPYRLAKDAFVTLTIYDRSGRVVREIDVGHRIAAVYESRSKAVHWDGRTEFGERVASGIYFYSLTAGDYSATRKMVILK